jgi:hypothetical protein
MSVMRTITFLVLVACSAALQVDDSDKAWERPITKVVNLLKDMATQLDVEAKEDEEQFSTMGCWCETNEKEKSAAIAEANRRIPELEATINEAAAKTAQLATEIEGLDKEVKQNKGALAEASSIRAKEHGDFENREKELVSNIASGTRAVDAIAKVQKGALIQGDDADEMIEVQKILKQHMSSNKKLLEQVQNMVNKEKKEFLSFLQIDSGAKAPKSAVIFGILKQMKEEFETTLADSKTDEEQAASDFAALKASKTKEINAGEDMIKQKSEQKADAEELNARSKEDHEDTSAQLAADTKFLGNVRESCKNFVADYQERVKARTTEIEAVSDTIGILTSDEASTAFSKSGSAVLLQLSSRTHRRSKAELARQQANRVLRRAGIKFQAGQPGPQARGAFDEVTKQIETMMAALKKEQKEENDKKDYCIAEFNANEKQTYDKNHIKTDLETKIADLTALTEQLNEQVAALKQEIADTLLAMKEASMNREKENAAFQVTIADQKATQKILKKALERLKDVYSASFLQHHQTPPVTAKAYSKNAGGSGVVAMVEVIMDDSKKVAADALKAENDAQAAYEEFITDSNASNQAANDEIAAKTESLAQADAESTTASGDLTATINDLLALGETNASLHKECDFLLKNFDTRQSKRTEEIEALMQAKYIFQGAGR